MPRAAYSWKWRLFCDSEAYLSTSEKIQSLILFLMQSSKFLKSCPAVSICVYHLLQESTENERAYYISSSDVLALAILFGICHLDWIFVSHFVILSGRNWVRSLSWMNWWEWGIWQIKEKPNMITGVGKVWPHVARCQDSQICPLKFARTNRAKYIHISVAH